MKNDARSSSGGVPGAPRTRQNRSQEPSERGKSRPRPFENLKVGANGSVGAQKVRCEPQRKAQGGGMNECSIGIIVRDNNNNNKNREEPTEQTISFAVSTTLHNGLSMQTVGIWT